MRAHPHSASCSLPYGRCSEFYLRKIQDIDDYIPSTRGKLVHFSKFKYLYSIISQLMQYQQTPYNLQPVAQIAALLYWKDEDRIPREDDPLKPF